MTTNHTITDTELEAIRSVERYMFTIAHEDAFRPSHEVQEDIEAVNWMLRRLAPAPPVEEVASRPNGEPPQPEDSQGPSVVDRSSREIEVRWAKETIGLVANELSRAYTEIEITRDGHTIPGKLGSIAKRLNEAMQRLGVVNYDDLDSAIPF